MASFGVASIALEPSLISSLFTSAQKRIGLHAPTNENG
jgi:hypothetical protein